MNKFLICGHFGGNNNFVDGQTVKTKNIYKSLLKIYGENEVKILDTYGWKKKPIEFFLSCIISAKCSKNIIILPAHNGVKIFPQLFLLLRKIWKFKLLYIVIGGWLPNYVKENKSLRKSLISLNKILVETENMKKDLVEQGFNNISILTNFKDNVPLKKEELIYQYDMPYKICTFSRVMEEKGITDICEVIKRINNQNTSIKYVLDIYGPIDINYETKFNEMQKKFPSYINYRGCIETESSVNILKNYYMLIFPTKFKTEGIPGTIIDAFAAGIPVIASRWDNVSDMIIDNENGYIYEFNDISDLESKLKLALNNIKINKMKLNSLKSFNNFDEKKVITKLLNEIEEC